nr:hypothetical protein [Sorangium cellulosum]
MVVRDPRAIARERVDDDVGLDLRPARDRGRVVGAAVVAGDVRALARPADRARRAAAHARASDALLELEQRFHVELELLALGLSEEALEGLELARVDLEDALVGAALRGRDGVRRRGGRRRRRGAVEGDAAEDRAERARGVGRVRHGLAGAAVRDDVALVGAAAIGDAQVDARDRGRRNALPTAARTKSALHVASTLPHGINARSCGSLSASTAASALAAHCSARVTRTSPLVDLFG